MNNVTLQGNLTDVPELNVEGKSPRCSFTLAVNERYRDSNGEWQQGNAEFVPIVCWGQLAENVFASLTKGDRALVTGKLRIRRDNEKTYVEVTADGVGHGLTFVSTQPVDMKVNA